MKIPFCLTIIALCVLHANSNPIIINSEESPKETPKENLEEIKQIETTGIKEEEKLGVFQENPTKIEEVKETGRQSTDDDDDDDDDDLGLDLDDDDDDDDASDDDDDYFDGIFDDILGEDDDDDDDDDDDEPAQPAPVQTPEDAVQNAQEEVAQAAETADQEVYTDAPGADSLIDKDPDAIQNTIQEPVVVQPIEDEEEEAEDDDDDDDEGDLDDLADDDDDDDDDDGAEDDDDDDDDLEDVIEAKRSRSLNSRDQKIPSVYIAKYNRFVDTIIERINTILGKSYDPVRVKLHKKSTTKHNPANNNNNKIKKRKSNKKKSKTPLNRQEATNKMGEIELARNLNTSYSNPNFVLISKTGVSNREEYNVENRAKTKKPSSVPNKTKNTKTKNKTKISGKNVQKARATLFGLSTLRRDGDVTVTTMSDHTTVKSEFVLGPLQLRVEKEFERQLKSATATTAEMRGRLNLRILQGGAATLHSIKVLQPKQVRVESADNHEKTKEFMWNKSSRIAKVVANKLAAAAKSMLQPAPGIQK
nr:protein PFC0760c-like isoform X1 [Onthophagus taurus]